MNLDECTYAELVEIYESEVWHDWAPETAELLIHLIAAGPEVSISRTTI